MAHPHGFRASGSPRPGVPSSQPFDGVRPGFNYAAGFYGSRVRALPQLARVVTAIMKALRDSGPITAVPRRVEFYHHPLDRHFRIENHAADVDVRTDQPELSAPQRESLVRHWAAEGFIPEGCRWFFHREASGGIYAVKWIVDGSWLQLRHRATRVRSRFLRPLLATAGTALLAGLTVLVLRALFSAR